MENMSSLLTSGNDISSVILGTPAASPANNYGDSSSDSGGGIWETLQSISATTWALIILILAFLGFNVFVYLAKGTQEVNQLLAPLITKIAGFIAFFTGQTVNTTSEGAKHVVTTGATAVNDGLSAVQEVAAPSSMPGVGEPVQQAQPQQQQQQLETNTLNRALNTAQSTHPNNNDYETDDASSKIQSGVPKSGWCYIGEDRGFRTCGQVGVNDTCMSGNIFPTQEICVNPALRA